MVGVLVLRPIQVLRPRHIIELPATMPGREGSYCLIDTDGSFYLTGKEVSVCLIGSEGSLLERGLST